MKDPAIHILFSSLVDLLARKVDYQEAMGLAKHILRTAHHEGLQIRDRSMVKGNTRQRKRTEKLVATDTDLAQQFQVVLGAVRRQAKHKVIQPVAPNSSLWALLKEVAALAKDYAEAFDLEVRAGMQEFCDIGLKLMGKTYSLGKFKYHAEGIAAYKTAKIEVANDPSVDKTGFLYTLWAGLVKEYSGHHREITDPREYANFVTAISQITERGKVKHEDWLRAQFDGLAWMGVTAEPYHLHGDKAGTRYDLYMTHKGAANKKKQAEAGTDVQVDEDAYWTALKKLEEA